MEIQLRSKLDKQIILLHEKKSVFDNEILHLENKISNKNAQINEKNQIIAKLENEIEILKVKIYLN